jgi:hypothetical protein
MREFHARCVRRGMSADLEPLPGYDMDIACAIVGFHVKIWTVKIDCPDSNGLSETQMSLLPLPKINGLDFDWLPMVGDDAFGLRTLILPKTKLWQVDSPKVDSDLSTPLSIGFRTPPVLLGFSVNERNEEYRKQAKPLYLHHWMTI